MAALRLVGEILTTIRLLRFLLLASLAIHPLI